MLEVGSATQGHIWTIMLTCARSRTFPTAEFLVAAIVGEYEAVVKTAVKNSPVPLVTVREHKVTTDSVSWRIT
jgi:hypothetical protein